LNSLGREPQVAWIPRIHEPRRGDTHRSVEAVLGLTPELPTSTKVPGGLQARLTAEEREVVLQRLRQRFAHIPAGVSLADELISERRAAVRQEET
jgi:coenzyme F420-reducing hydrogenase alpha subunit